VLRVQAGRQDFVLPGRVEVFRGLERGKQLILLGDVIEALNCVASVSPSTRLSRIAVFSCCLTAISVWITYCCVNE